ncbi:MAG: hypothetical protein JNM17_34205, partial [Archangium sp.]|nr:hypothetical protein [Archangium sp.]
HLPDARCFFLTPLGAVFDVARDTLAAHQRPFELEFIPQTKVPQFLTLDAAIIDARTKDPDVVFFLALHGGDGENGVTQKILETHRVAYTCSDSAASAAAFDKPRAKELAAAKGATIAEAVVLPPMSVESARRELTLLLEKTKPPGATASGGETRWVLKPRADGSSHGLIHLKDLGEVEAAAQTLAKLQLAYLAEVFIAGRELTVGVMDEALDGTPKALPVSEVRLIPGGSFDYQGKYLGRGTEEITPAEISDLEARAAQSLAVLTHQAVGCFGYTRTDMILTPEGRLVLLEINTLPGMTKASFIPQQLAVAERPVKAFLEQQIELARARHRKTFAV